MKSKKILALMMGAIIASSRMSQTAVQVYADDGKLICSSKSMEDTLDAEPLTKIRPRTFSRGGRSLMGDKWSSLVERDLYTSERNLVFEPISDTEVQLVYFDFSLFYNKDVNVPQNVIIEGKTYTVTSIGNWAFENCASINITLPSSITEIGEGAFCGCRYLGLKELPAGITKIGKRAFAYCKRIQLTELPSGITEIGEYTFNKCRCIKLTELPSGITEIGVGAFGWCYGLRLTELPSGITKINDMAFSDCSDLQLVKLPSGITEIGDEAFADCPNLQLTELPSGITRIGERAFYFCRRLSLTELPEGLLEIGEYTFFGANIRRIIIPATVTELGRCAFNTNSLRMIALKLGSSLTDEDLKRSYGDYIEQVKIVNVDEIEGIFWKHKTISNLDELGEQNECPVCITPFSVGDEIVEFPCHPKIHHYLCRECFEESYKYKCYEIERLCRKGMPIPRQFACQICRTKYDIDTGEKLG